MGWKIVFLSEVLAFITVTPALSASSSVLPGVGDAPLVVSFTGTPSGGSAPYTFAWTFGDYAPTTLATGAW